MKPELKLRVHTVAPANAGAHDLNVGAWEAGKVVDTRMRGHDDGMGRCHRPEPVFAPATTVHETMKG